MSPLSLALWTPLACLLVLLALPSSQKTAIKIWANVSAVLGLLTMLPLITGYDRSTGGFQFIERA